MSGSGLTGAIAAAAACMQCVTYTTTTTTSHLISNRLVIVIVITSLCSVSCSCSRRATPQTHIELHTAVKLSLVVTMTV